MLPLWSEPTMIHRYRECKNNKKKEAPSGHKLYPSDNKIPNSCREYFQSSWNGAKFYDFLEFILLTLAHKPSVHIAFNEIHFVAL